MFKQVYIVLLGIILVSFTYSLSSFTDDSDGFNQPISRPRPLPHEGDSLRSNEMNQNENQGGGEFESSKHRFREEMLNAHNIYRTRHCVPPLRLDDDLSRSAQIYAERLARMNGMVQTDANTVGQNIYMKSTSSYLDYISGK
jgi:hypothetical protein